MKKFVTARSTIDNSQIFIKCQDVREALNIAGKLNRLELKEHSYVQVRLRSSQPPLRKYKEILKDFIV